jgi:peptidoglycan/xylan/chitin deacetylase (PgdA/CDA1 family)
MRKSVVSTLIILSLFSIILLSAIPWTHGGYNIHTAQISLTIDDGREATLLNAYPILKVHNISATSYVITDDVGKRDYMNLSQLLELQSSGWEIGSHSCSHPHMTRISSDQALHELNDSKKWLEARGINLSSFAFPYGDENSNLTHLASNLYELTRGTGNDYFYDTVPKDRYFIAVSLPGENNKTFSYIERAIREKAWIIFYFHDVDDNGHVVGHGQDLREIADYIQKKVQMGQLKAVTVREGFEELRVELNESLQQLEKNMESGMWFGQMECSTPVSMLGIEGSGSLRTPGGAHIISTGKSIEIDGSRI